MAEEKKEEIIIPEEEVATGTPPEGYTLDEWASLSQEEREVLSLKVDENGEIVEELPAEIPEDALKAIAGEEVEGEKPIEDVVTAEVTLEEKSVKEEPILVTDGDLLSFRPTIDESMLPKPEPEIISGEIQLKLTELDTQYDAGDLKLTDYNQQRDTLNRQIIFENNQRNQSVRDAARSDLIWKAEQGAFFRARSEYEYAKDGSPKGKALYGALNEMVKTLDADPANAGMSGMSILVKADKIVKEIFGMNIPKAVEPVKLALVKKTEEKPPARIPADVTLMEVPVAKGPSTDSPWTALDKLTGAEYERALGKLSSEQLERYERAH